MSVEFQYSETLFAEEIGLTRGEVKFHRDNYLREGIDWRIVQKKGGGGEIGWSGSAVKRVWRRLAGRPATFDLARCLIGASHQKNGAEPILLGSAASPIPRKMTIYRVPLNPRTVVVFDEQGKKQLVWVGRNSTFVVGDEIEVVPHEAQQDCWRLVSPIPRDRRRAR